LKKSNKNIDNKRPLSSADFIDNNPRVKACINRLENSDKIGPGGKKLVVSDLIDDQGHQYVNLVQKGGGVLGVALVGYTHILEQMNIRFLRLAGTSAGAINTGLMTVIGKKTDCKSAQIADVMGKLDFFNLVDGHPVAQWLIKKLVTQGNFLQKVENIIAWTKKLLFGLIFLDILFFGWQHKWFTASLLAKFFFVLTGFSFLIIAVVVFYIQMLLTRLKDSGFGINPGDYFYDWLKMHLCKNGVKTVADLNDKASGGKDFPDLTLRSPRTEGTKDLVGDVTFIASELVSQNKIQFPLMSDLFRESTNMDLEPAGFIRASMSIPIFFESYFINDIPIQSAQIRAAWLDRFNQNAPPSMVRFVDGGILSNFPIDIFYNQNIAIPRLPSFGINLDDTKPNEKEQNPQSWSLLGYFGRIFNTIRNYYDKDFQIKNRVLSKGVGTIKLSQFNWLNFSLSSDDKIEMFSLGAEAATDFLLNFDWDSYKTQRKQMQIDLNR
jgi:NTE family protein